MSNLGNLPTPGLWVYHKVHAKAMWQVSQNLTRNLLGDDIAWVEREADARLIAAAPELFDMVNEISHDRMVSIDRAGRLVAKILGEE